MANDNAVQTTLSAASINVAIDIATGSTQQVSAAAALQRNDNAIQTTASAAFITISIAPISQEIQALAPSALIELFVLDTSVAIAGGSMYYFHAGTNQLGGPVVWQGIVYQPLPIEASGFDFITRGSPPRPKIKVANTGGLFSALIDGSDDLIGCKVIRKRTFVRYLDSVNFSRGTNPQSDPNQHLEDDIWFVDRKVSENKYLVEWELASALDLSGIMLPYRQVIQNSCPWKYRGPECGWTGAYYDVNDQPTNAANDFCAKKLSSCKVRWGTASYPYGGFPGVTQYG